MNLQKFLDKYGYEEVHELSPFDVIDSDGERCRVDYADSNSVGIEFSNGEGMEFMHKELESFAIDLHEMIREVFY